jgi:hypothetical protein
VITKPAIKARPEANVSQNPREDKLMIVDSVLGVVVGASGRDDVSGVEVGASEGVPVGAVPMSLVLGRKITCVELAV